MKRGICSLSNAKPWARAGKFLLSVPAHIGGGVPESNLTSFWTSRLKILKDEIRKPYFIKLKRFLREQGVKASNNSAKNLKIYPSRSSIRFRSFVSH